MNAVALLDTLRERGVELYVVDGKVRYRAPVGAIDDDLRRSAAEHRGELLALLTWDAGAADAELRRAVAVIDKTLLATWITSAQKNVVGVFKEQVQNYHTRRDPLLFGSPVWIEAHVERWRSEHEEAIRRI